MYPFKIISKVLIFISLPLSIGNAIAQNREIQDSLIYTDPTVSSSSGYIYGGSVEYWNTSPSATYTSWKNTLTQTGVNFFIGKDNLTAAVAYRGDGTSYREVGYGDTSSVQEQKFSEIELTLRVLSKEGYLFNSVYPYLFGGYTFGKSTYYSNGNTTAGTTNISSPILGFGGIIPFNEKVGLRLDAKGYIVSQGAGRSIGAGSTGGNIVTGNFYWSIDKEWNAQIGVRKIEYSGSSNLAFAQRGNGYFLMLGKTYK